MRGTRKPLGLSCCAIGRVAVCGGRTVIKRIVGVPFCSPLDAHVKSVDVALDPERAIDLLKTNFPDKNPQHYLDAKDLYDNWLAIGKKLKHGPILENAGVAKPSAIAGYKNLHAHHIVMKKIDNGNLVNVQTELLESQQILKKYGIDPVCDVDNLTWAINHDHTEAYVKSVHAILKDYDDGTRQGVLNALAKITLELSEGRIFRYGGN